MFFFGTLQEGPCGMTTIAPADDEEIEDYSSYGVDWEVNDDETMMAHLLENNPQDWEDENPFASASTPGKLSEVFCDPPNCPFTDEQLHYLDTSLAQRVDVFSRNMSVCQLVWQEALSLSQELYDLGTDTED
ncbi:hypothetical protein PILCRDRAFT_742016 [Piloderma croceum F 1598]|uniref:Uncharacterized protein n=1 Tax=Piloderma croceum (strain F 1598) TaxID=765440 RepID=A0A0C3B526_PILCF|nr:hypothetical protein PILCRDRAFT_742016 [Piloderma croceum F 1598]